MLWTGSATSAAFFPQTLLWRTTSELGYPRPDLPLDGSLKKLLWNDYGIRLDTKLSGRLYKAAVVSSLIYMCESLVLYRRHVVKLEHAVPHALPTANCPCQVHIPNTEVLQICSISGIKAFLISAQLRWTGHVIRMNDNKLPKLAFYSQLEHGTRSNNGQRKRYKDMLKCNLKACSIDLKELETLAVDRSSSRAMCIASVQHLESQRVAELKKKRSLRKAGGRPTTGGFSLRHVSPKATSVLLGLVSTHTAELILTRDLRSVVSTAQSIINAFKGSLNKTSSSAIAERSNCSVGQFWPK